MLDNYFASQTLSSPLIPQQLVDPLQVQGFSGSNLISPQTITFVDQNISDAMTVMANLQSDVKVFLDPTRDGVAQITETLGQYKNLTGVNIISHANVAQLQLGKSFLSAESLSQYTNELQKWSVSLATGADILFYGCNVAFGESGQAFVTNLSALTGADIAASTNFTGNSLQGGDWILEYSTGNIETANPLSHSLMSSYQGVFESVFTTQTPAITNATDGTGSNGDYELGMEFQSAKAGTINSIRYYKAASETGTHVGRIWSSNGTLLASVTFTNETASGWQEQALATPLTIAANTKYVVSVNANQYYVATANGLASTLTNGDISAVADGSNGVFNETPSAFPTQSWNNTNYFRDIVFTAFAPVNNTTGTVALTGTATQNQTLSASVSDANGLNGVTINYQWQQSANGSTWTNLTGATNSTLTLGQAQVGNQVRVNAIYTDALGSSENILSTPTTVVANVNDLGTVAIAGSTVVGQVLTANVTDLDGLNGASPSYQWQQSTNGTTWTNVSGATTQSLTLDSTLVGNQLRVNTTYTDALGTAENILSNPTSAITAVAATQSLFTSQVPVTLNATDGTGSNGDYELGMEFQSAKAGTINSIRYYKAASETGTHVGRIWSSNGTLLASVTFTNETASGWQEQALATPLTIAANTKYVVSVNVNQYYVSTNNGLASTLTNGDISAVADGSNGVFNETPSAFPTQSWNNTNYFRDIVFTAFAPVNNTTGTVALTGTATQNQTLSASVSDANGLNGVTINYQWQQSANGSTWTNLTGATNSTLTLGQAQVGNQVRVNAIYTDALGSSENILSTPTTVVANVNDLGTVAIAGSTVVGQVLTANVTDLDGLNGASPSYQWQQSTNGTTWTNVSGATTQSLTLDSTLVGNQLRVNTTYTDALGTAENILSNPTSAITAVAATQSLFTSQVPVTLNATDGTGSNGDYELGMEFQSAKAGTINSIRYYKAASETGTHVGRIWSSNGTLLASVTFTNETASGWQEQALATPLTIAANTKYVVSVNVNQYYVSTNNGLASTLTNGDISAVADGSNGVFNETPSAFPTQSWNNTNYFRDIVFTAFAPVNNTTGTVALTGTATQNQTLNASVSDANGLNGVTINYQWQQSANGSTWTNLTGATNSTLTLGQAQVGNQVRVNAIYTDALGSSENILSTPTTVVANVNDLGTVAIAGSTVVGQVLTANVTDLDGLNGVTPSYQWQQSTNGTNWTNVSGATTQSLTLDSTLVGNQLRVNTTYTDALGTSENILSNPTSAITAVVAPTQTFFASTAIPTNLNNIDNGGDDYELGMRFTTTAVGQIQAIRYYKSPSETGSHVGRIWSSTGQLLASVTFTNETASGWQEQVLATPLAVTPSTTYVVSVNTNTAYTSTNAGFASPISNGVINTPVGAGVYNFNLGDFPTQTFQNENYYRDIVFFNSNNLGSIALNGTAIEDQTLTASVSDTDGLTGTNISYQWQKLENDNWTDISGATQRTLKLGDALVNQQLRVRATYTDALGSSETLVSSVTAPVTNINDLGAAILKGSATTESSLTATVLDDDGLAGVTVNYQWQELVNDIWINIAGATGRTLALGSSLLDKQVRMATTYTDLNGTLENIFSFGTNITAQNAIVLENQKTGTTAWQITNLATNNEILGYASATSVNQGEVLPIKISLAQPGQYRIDVYRLGYYGGDGGRLITSSGLLNGGIQTGSTFDLNTRLFEANWNTSYNLQIGNDWTSGLYIAKLTDITTGKESQINFAVRDDDRPADLGFQASFTTYEAYNNYGGYSTYTSNSLNDNRAFKVSFDRPIAPTHQGTVNNDGYTINNMMTWEYNMVRWLESQGYDVSYYTNLDVHTNPLQLYSQDTFLSVGHDEYWSMEMFDSVTKARDNGINLAFFSANTAYWRVRFEDSSTGEPNRVMVSYKSSWALDPLAQNDISQATTLFRSPELNSPENSLLGVAYIGDNSTSNSVTQGFNFVVSNSSDPYYAYTGLQNGDVLSGLVGYEWDAVLNNGFTPEGVVVLSASPVVPGSIFALPPLPPGTDVYTSNAVRYTAPSGAKVFSTGSIQWAWGLDSYGVTDRVDPRVQQITVNALADMGAKPQTPSANIVIV